MRYFDPKLTFSCATLPPCWTLAPFSVPDSKIVVDNMWGMCWLADPDPGGGSTELIQVHAERNRIFPEMSRPEPIPPRGCRPGPLADGSAPTASAFWTGTPIGAVLVMRMASSWTSPRAIRN